jgi:site-specific DNA recombinase
VIDRHVTRIIVRPNSIDIELREPTPAPKLSLATEASVTAGVAEPSASTTFISLPWSAPAFASVKGVLHRPEAKPTLKGETRDAILLAIAKARSWIGDIASGRTRSFDEIATREGKVERHIRLLTPLAFIPPRTLAAIVDGTGPHDATVTALAQAVPHRWDGSPAGQSSDHRRSRLASSP